MRPRLHPQGQCPEPTERLLIVGAATRTPYSLCAECRAIYEAAPFAFTFVPAATPEWRLRSAEGSNRAADKTGALVA